MEAAPPPSLDTCIKSMISVGRNASSTNKQAELIQSMIVRVPIRENSPLACRSSSWFFTFFYPLCPLSFSLLTFLFFLTCCMVTGILYLPLSRSGFTCKVSAVSGVTTMGLHLWYIISLVLAHNFIILIMFMYIFYLFHFETVLLAKSVKMDYYFLKRLQLENCLQTQPYFSASFPCSRMTPMQ